MDVLGKSFALPDFGVNFIFELSRRVCVGANGAAERTVGPRVLVPTAGPEIPGLFPAAEDPAEAAVGVCRRHRLVPSEASCKFRKELKRLLQVCCGFFEDGSSEGTGGKGFESSMSTFQA